LGVMQLLLGKVRKVAFFRPIINDNVDASTITTCCC
jgi:BioD-like phosphotransacetylase family protein